MHQLHNQQQQLNRNAQFGMMLHNGDMALATTKVEPLEHNAELGIYLQQTNLDGEGPREIYFA